MCDPFIHHIHHRSGGDRKHLFNLPSNDTLIASSAGSP
jgi:hypothetical protein